MRNLFFDVFNMESSSYPKERNHIGGKNYQVTKTHQLPNHVPGFRKDDFVICLVRDGRDAIVSNSHYRKNFIDSDSDFNENIREGIIAPAGTHFGGWSKNVCEWSKHANIIIRFEDLIKEPVLCLTQIAKKIDLPQPDYSKVKSFYELKNGTPRYGSGGKGVDRKKFAQNFYHKGIVGANKTEMTDSLRKLFWLFHGDIMEQLGYSYAGDINKYIYQENTLIKRNRKLKSVIIAKQIKLRYFLSWLLHSIILNNKIKSIKRFINLRIASQR